MYSDITVKKSIELIMLRMVIAPFCCHGKGNAACISALTEIHTAYLLFAVPGYFQDAARHDEKRLNEVQLYGC